MGWGVGVGVGEWVGYMQDKDNVTNKFYTGNRKYKLYYFNSLAQNITKLSYLTYLQYVYNLHSG